MNPDDRIYIAGHRGLVGSALVRRLEREGFRHLIVRPRAELDLRDAAAVRGFFEAERPTHVFLAASRVGGILANRDHPADFIRDNLLIETNVLHEAYRSGVRRLLFLGSSCVYPRDAPQPIREEHLLTGPLEKTNEAYAVAKIAGIQMCAAYRAQYGADFIVAMPTNLYGPGDNFDPATSHVLPALMGRCHAAREAGAPELVVWGTGRPRREFMHVDDMADACVFLMRHAGPEPVNVGVGEDLSIAELAALVADVVGYRGVLRFDPSKPDGTPRKLLDVSRLRALGWGPRIGLREGVESTYRWFRAQSEAPRARTVWSSAADSGLTGPARA